MLGGIQNLTGHGPGQPCTRGLCFEQGPWTSQSSRGLFPPQLFSSVIASSSNGNLFRISSCTLLESI